LQDLDESLADESKALGHRRMLVQALLEEGIEDPLEVTAADAAEERAIARLRRLIPDVGPAELGSRARGRAAGVAASGPARLGPRHHRGVHVGGGEQGNLRSEGRGAGAMSRPPGCGAGRQSWARIFGW
jgi:hypothetical protein